MIFIAIDIIAIAIDIISAIWAMSKVIDSVCAVSIISLVLY